MSERNSTVRTSLTRRAQRRSWLRQAAAVALVLGTTTAKYAHAANVFIWDPDGNATGNNQNGTNIGGSGTWNTTNTNWWNSTAQTTGTESTWISSQNAVITGPQTNNITLGSAITASNGILNYVPYVLSGTNTLTLAGTITASGAVATLNVPIAGTGFTTAAGTVVLGGNNTFTGFLNLSSGQLNIDSATALGASGTIFTIQSGSIDTNGVTITNVNPENWYSNFTFNGSANLNTGTGAVSLGGSAIRTVTTNASTFTVGGVISGAASGIIKAGAGSMALSGANTFSAGINASAGTLDINNATALGTGTFTINGGNIDNTTGGSITESNNNAQAWLNDFTFNGTQSLNLGTGAVQLNGSGTARTVTVNANTLTVGGGISAGTTVNSLTKAGAGTLVLNGSSTFTGPTVISAGTLSLGGTLASTSLTLNSGTSFVVSATQAGQSFASTTFNGAAGTSAQTATIVANYTGNSTLALGAITRNFPATVDFTLPTSGSITTTTANASFTGGQPSIIGDWATVSGSSWAVSGASGGTPGAITALTTYSPTFAAGTDVDAPTGSYAPGSMTINSLRFNSGSNTYSINDSGSGDTLNIATGGILETANVGNNSVTLNVANLTSGNGQDLTIIQNNPSNSLTVNSNISGAISLVKSGAGPLVLGGVNTYTGSTYLSGSGSVTVNNSTANLNLSNTNNSAFTGGLILNGATVTYTADNNLGAASAGVTLNGGTLNFAGTSVITDTHVVNFSGNGTINVAQPGLAGGKITFGSSGQLVGGGSVTKTGPGWITINGTNTDTGNWQINAGAVELGGTLGASSVAVALSGDGTTNPYTSGELVATNRTVANGISLNGGILSADGGGGTYSGTIQVNQNSTLRLGNFWGGTNGPLTLSGGYLINGGNLSLANSLSNIPTLSYGGTTNQVLTIGDDTTSYSGTLTVDGGHEVVFTSGTALIGNNGTGAIIATGTPSAIPVLSTDGFIKVPTANTSNAPVGVYALGHTSVSTTINLSTLYDGNWYLGANPNNTSLYGTIIPGSVGGVPTYHLGGGGGSLFLGSGGQVAQQGGTVTNVVIGATDVGGTGQVRYNGGMTTTGTTTINGGSTLQLDFADNSPPASNILTASTPLVLSGGTLTAVGKANTVNAQTLNGVTINPGGSSAIVDSSNGSTNPLLITLGTVARNVGGTVDFSLNGTANASNGISSTLANTNGIIGGWATWAGNSWAYNTGNGIIGSFGSFNASTAASATPVLNANVDFQASNSTAFTSQTINSLRFGTAVASTMTIGSGSTIVLASGGIIESAAVGNNATTITGGTLEGASGSDLVVNEFNTNANGSLTINSTIADNGSATALTKSGNGTLVLGGTNTFTGPTYLNAGTLSLTNSLALQNSTLTTSAVGGAVNFGSLSAATLGGLAGNQYITLNNTVVTNNVSGLLALSVGNNNASTNYAGGFVGTGSLIKVGTGTLTLSGVSNFSGGTSVNAGNLRVTGTISGAGAVNVNAGGLLSGTGTINSPVVVAGGSTTATQGGISLVDSGIGTLTLNNGLTIGGASPSAPGALAFDINSTTSDLLNLGSSAFNVSAGGATISINSLVSGAMINSNATYNLVSFGSGIGAGFATGSGSAVGGISLASTKLTFGVTGSLNVTNTGISLVTSVTSAPSTAYWSGVQGATWSATDPTVSYGNFTSDPAGQNFITAYPGSNTNVIFTAVGNNSPQNLTNTLGQNFDINSLTFITGTAATSIGGTNQTLTLEGGGISIQNGAGPVLLSMTSLVLNQGQTWTNSGTGPLTVSSNVSGSGSLTTTGTVVMTGTNNYSGGLTVNSGLLQFGGGGSLNSTGNLSVNGTLDMNGSNVTIATLSGSGVITNGAGASGNATLTTNANSDSNFSGSLSDSGAGKSLSLVKNGSNTLTLSGSNSYTGGTALNAGSIIVGSPTALGNGGNLTIKAGTLDLNGVGGGGGAQSISIGSLSGIGGTIIDNGSNAGITTLNVNQSTGGVFAGLLTDGSNRQIALVKNGSATLSLNNIANNYSGGTTINTGKLTSGLPGTIGTGPVTLNGGTLALGQSVSGFGSNGSGWTVNQVGTYNTSQPVITGNVLTLTDGSAGGNQGRYAFYNTPLAVSNAGGFTANFTYTLGANRAADGIAFVVENDPRGDNIVNGTGGSLGATGTAQSGDVAFNLYNNVSQTGFNTNGGNATPNNMTTGGINLHTGGPSFNVSLVYNGISDTLSETVVDATTPADSYSTTYTGVNFQSILNGTNAYVGFTGSDGGSIANQSVSNFSFQSGSGGTWNNNVVINAGTTSGIEADVASASIGSLTLQAGSTLDVTGGTSLASNTSYAVLSGNVNLTGAVTLNIASNGTGNGIFAPGGLNDGGVTPSNLIVAGNGQFILSNAAVSLADGTVINLTGTTSMSVNDPNAIGTQASLNVATGATATFGANGTVGSLNGAGTTNIYGSYLNVGGTSTLNPNSTYSGTIGGSGNLNVNGGTFTLTDTGSIGTPGMAIASGAAVNLNGQLTGTPAVSVGTLNGSAATLTLGAADASNNAAAGFFLRNLSSLTINQSSTVSLAPATVQSQRQLLSVASLSMSGSTGTWTSKLDLSNNDLDVRNGSIGMISNQIAQGFANGSWQGSGGIVSSAAAGNPAHLTALGAILNNTDGTTPLNGTFDGINVGAGDVLVKYTYYGDANLDGSVSSVDYTLIDGGFLSQGSAHPLTGWYNGDFNYDGVINGSDYTLIDNAFNEQGATLSTEIASATVQIAGSGASSAVPEPASGLMLALGAIGLLGRRRRNQA